MSAELEISTKELTSSYIVPSYGRFDLEIVSGSGTRVLDETGREFLDFGAGIAVCSLGHCHPEVTAAVTEQAGRLVHTSNLYFTPPQAALARRLVDVVGTPGKIFFCNSGAEANEGLIKLSRKFGNATGGRYEILTFRNSFHGRTMAGISATGQDKVKTGFAPLLEGFQHLPFGDIDAVRAAFSEKTVAVLVEPVQGEGGIHIASAGFLQALRALCDEHNALLLFDEVQCGLGRTGDWCGWKSMAGDTVIPDGVSWAKGIANGFPLGAFWIRAKELEADSAGGALCELLGPGSHGTTYGGNPVACAAALKVLEIIERDGLLENALKSGAFLRDAIADLPGGGIQDVRAVGLMIGIQLAEDFPKADAPSPALHFTKTAMRHGLLVIPAGERVIRLLPPLNIREEDARLAVERIQAVLEEIFTPSPDAEAL